MPEISSDLLELPQRQLVSQFLEALRALPEGVADIVWSEGVPSQRDAGYDVRIDSTLGGAPVTLLVEVKKSVYPRDVHQALWRLKSLDSRGGVSQGIPVLAAESLSPGAKDLLRAEGVGYFDSGGSLYLSATGVYVFVDKPPPKAHAAATRSLFTGRRAQAIHALLMRRDEWMGVKQLAAISQVSPATASVVLTELEKFEWIETRGLGPSKERFLRDPRALLDAWAKQVSADRAPVLRRYFVPGVKAEALFDLAASAFEAHEVLYAVSHEAAAQLYTPFLSHIGQVRCRVLAMPAADAALADLGARVVTEGANFAINEVKSAGDLLFRERVGNAWLASPIHVYLDLLKGEGRAKEMAAHLRKERIRC